MDIAAVRESYCRQRGEDAAHMLELVRDLDDDVPHLLEQVFWDNAALDADRSLKTFYAPLPERKKFNAVSFDPADSPPEICDIGSYAALRVTLHRVLTLGDFDDPEAFFAALSHKNRKKLRWLRNAVPALGAKIVPIENEDGLDAFEKLYAAQFPKHPAGCPANAAVRRIYREFHRCGRSFSFLLLAPDGEPLSAALSYLCGDNCCFTHLTRSRSEYDKYSPGYYLTFRMLTMLLAEHPEIKYFFMGPGDYDYKRAFLGEPFSIYRMERRAWWNWTGLLRLRFRRRKERRLWDADQGSTVSTANS